MAVIGYHCSHEQYSPSVLLKNVKHAAEAGIKHAMCSDHFYPWSRRQGQSGFAWSWLGAALEATDLSFGTVSAPGQRYHPAIIAQAASTLAEMYPDRFWLSVGSGEALNESITGTVWPEKNVRNRRLAECVDILRALWAGETVNHDGLVTVRDARLYSRAVKPPPVIAACLSADTARWAATWADGMITITQDSDSTARIVDAFRENGGDGKPMYLQAVLSFAPTNEEALQSAKDQWRQAALPKEKLADLDSVEAFEQACANITLEDIRSSIRISSSTAEHVDWLAADAALGFERIYLHNVHRDQEWFLCEFAKHMIPAFQEG